MARIRKTARSSKSRDEMPPGFPWPDFPEEPQLCAPGDIDPDMLAHYAKKLG